MIALSSPGATKRGGMDEECTVPHGWQRREQDDRFVFSSGHAGLPVQAPLAAAGIAGTSTGLEK